MALLNEINVKGVPHPIVTDDGYYQEMTVGDAEQLVATTFTEDDAPYNFRTAGGAIDIGDRKQVEAIVGGSIKWNQLAPIPSSSKTKTESGITLTDNRDGSYSISGTAEVAIYDKFFVVDSKSWTKNHKYILLGCPSSGSDSTYRLALRGVGGDSVDAGQGVIWNPGTATWKGVAIYVAAGVEITTPVVFKPQIFDITKMFGADIADYIYSLEQSNAGAGVAWFKKLFPKTYYAYNAGTTPMSTRVLRHITRGFNAWDEDWAINLTINGIGGNIGSKNHIPVVRGASYYVYSGAYRPSANGVRFEYYDADKNSIGGAVRYSGPYTFPDDCCYIKFGIQQSIYGTTYKNDICINLSWDGERDGEYEEYEEHVYEFDPDLELKGKPVLSAGNDLYFDGDTYAPDGTVTRNWGLITLDGTENWTAGSSNVFYVTGNVTNLLYRYASNVKALCYDKYKFYGTKASGYSSMEDNQFLLYYASEASTTIREIAFRDSSVDDLTAWQAKLQADPITLVVEIPSTTEEADSYLATQIVDDFGTEEFVDAGVVADPPTRDVAIPVGHNSLYQPNLRAKLEMAPDSPDSDGYYVVYHHDGINEYVPLIIPDELPDMPTEDGTYILKCTVASGTATLSFEEVTE